MIKVGKNKYDLAGTQCDYGVNTIRLFRVKLKKKSQEITIKYLRSVDFNIVTFDNPSLKCHPGKYYFKIRTISEENYILKQINKK